MNICDSTSYMYNRLLSLPKKPTRSSFLWGPRQVGKSTLIKETYPEALVIDLLKSDEFIRFQERPSLLREILAKKEPKTLTVIDEVQKVPLLLDEVHWLIENQKLVFLLCGSSARKLKRAQANLLGGRALRQVLLGLTVEELGTDFDLEKLIHRGNLPTHFLCENEEWLPLIRSYVSDYLKEEIAAEAAVKNLPAFTSFLTGAALSDTEPINFTRFGSDVGVSGHTVKEYFQILVDTYLGTWLNAYTKRQKRRIKQTPKFYFENLGVVNYLAKRGQPQRGSEQFGKAFENFIFHEIHAYQAYRLPELEIYYWALTGQSEVDFILGDMEVAVEVKSSSRITADHFKGLREIKKDHPKIKRRMVVCLEERARITEDGIEIIPYLDFLKLLWASEIV